MRTDLMMEELNFQGISLEEFADSLGMELEDLFSKICGRTEFEPEQLLGIKNLLGLTEDEMDELFFGIKVS